MRRWSIVLGLLVILVVIGAPLVAMAADWPVRLIAEQEMSVLPYSDYSSRNTTYAAGRDWVSVSLGSDNSLYMISTADQGATWENVTLWHAPSWNRDMDYCFDGTYFYFTTSDYTEESDNLSLLYRRGAPQTDGTMTWATDNWQVAVAYGGTYVYEDPHIAVGADGEPFIVYESADEETFLDMSIGVARSNATENGTWVPNWSDSQAAALNYYFSACCVAEDVYLVVALDEDSELWAWTYSDAGFSIPVELQDGGGEGDLFYVSNWRTVLDGESVELVYSIYESLGEGAVEWIVARTYDIEEDQWSAPVTLDTWAYTGGAGTRDVSIAVAGDDVYAFWTYDEWAEMVQTAGWVTYAEKVDGDWGAPAYWLDTLAIGIEQDQTRLDTAAGTNAEEHIPVVFTGTTDAWETYGAWFTGLDVTPQSPTPPETSNFVPAVVAYMVMMLLLNVPMALAGRAGYEVSGTMLGLINLLFVLVALMVILFPYLSA